jgi:ferric-dicitrate binding protein FerR (iron transport regulator)
LRGVAYGLLIRKARNFSSKVERTSDYHRRMNQMAAAFAAWREADAAARAAENRLQEAWAAFEVRAAEPPPAQLLTQVSQLRAVANAKLAEAMKASGAQGVRL